MSRVFRIGVVEGELITPSRLQQAVRAAEGLELLECFPNAEALLRWKRRRELEVVLVDLIEPGGLDCQRISKIVEGAPWLRVLAVTDHRDRSTVVSALRSGCAGYLLRSEAPAAIAAAVERAQRGLHVVSDDVLGVLVNEVLKPVRGMLSDREEQLAHSLAEGLTYAQCSARMGIAVGTVQDYVKRVYRKLEVNSRKEVRLWVEKQQRV